MQLGFVNIKYMILITSWYTCTVRVAIVVLCACIVTAYGCTLLDMAGAKESEMMEDILFQVPILTVVTYSCDRAVATEF